MKLMLRLCRATASTYSMWVLGPATHSEQRSAWRLGKQRRHTAIHRRHTAIPRQICGQRKLAPVPIILQDLRASCLHGRNLRLWTVFVQQIKVSLRRVIAQDDMTAALYCSRVCRIGVLIWLLPLPAAVVSFQRGECAFCRLVL